QRPAARATRRRWPRSREARAFWTRVHLGATARQNTGSGGKNAVERGPGAAFDQRFTSGDVKGVPYGTGDDSRSIRLPRAFVKERGRLVAALITAARSSGSWISGHGGRPGIATGGLARGDRLGCIEEDERGRTRLVPVSRRRKHPGKGERRLGIQGHANTGLDRVRQP